MSEKVKEKSNFNQAVWLGISQASAFLLAFVSSAILSRYFDKTDYATYKQVMYVYATLQTVFTAGLPGVFSYFIPRLNPGQGKTLVNKITTIFFILGLLFSLLLFLSSGLIASILENPDLTLAIKVFSPFPLLTIPTMGIEGIYTALKETKFIAIYQTISKLAMLICIVVPVLFFKGNYISAIIGWGIASFITFLVAMWMKYRPYVGIRKELIPGMYKMVFSYSLPLMGSSLVGLILHSGNQFFISRYYGTAAFANFSNGFIPLPFVAMVTGSVKSVLLPVFSKSQSQGKIGEAVQTYNNAVNQSIIIIYPLVIFFMIFANQIVTILFSDRYIESGIYLQISLCKDLIEVFPYFAILMAFGKSNIYFLIHLICALLLWGIDFIVVYLHLGPHYIAGVSSLIQITIVISALMYVKCKLNVPIMKGRELKGILMVFISSLGACIIAKLILSVIPISDRLLQLIFGFIIYLPVLLLIGNIFKVDYSLVLKRIKLKR